MPSKLEILLIKRGHDPFKGMWALPGGFVDVDELLSDAASRELEEETGLKDVNLQQLYVVDKVDRDPRERIITIAFYGFIGENQSEACAGSDAAEISWFDVSQLPPMACDHEDIVKYALSKIKKKAGTS